MPEQLQSEVNDEYMQGIKNTLKTGPLSNHF